MDVLLSSPGSRFRSVTLPVGSCVQDVLDHFSRDNGVPAVDFYVTHDGRRAGPGDLLQAGALYHLGPRLCGGKGGFGSMLRALGAQIEKTTNREACRDLSGRRLRDVNHEKEMAEWLKKQAEQEGVKDQRRLERLQNKLLQPKHHFTDTEYQQQCHDLSERLDDSVLKGMQASSAGLVCAEAGPSAKRTNQHPGPLPRKKKCFWTGVGDLDSDEEEGEEEGPGSEPAGTSTSAEPWTSTSAEPWTRPTRKHRDKTPHRSSDARLQLPSSAPQPGPEPVGSAPQSEPDVAAPQPEPVGSAPQSEPDVAAPQPEPVGSAPQSEPDVAAPQPEPVGSAPQSEPDVAAPQPEPVDHAPQSEPDVATPHSEPDGSAPQVDPVGSAPQSEPDVATPQADPFGSAPQADPVSSTPQSEESRGSDLVSGPVDLDLAGFPEELEVLGLDGLKAELMSRGLKCGGSLKERATRLFSVKGLRPEQIDPALLAKAPKGKKK